MSGTERTTALFYRLMVLAIVALALSALSFNGTLDDFARERIAKTTRESVGIYAVSRTINAGVSVLQSSQVKVPFLASLQLGEILDPINDGIERLSSTVVWAIGSLFVQRIVLDVTSSMVFRWIFLASGLLALLAMLPLGSTRFKDFACRVSGISALALDGFCRGVVRIFVVAAVLRFIVPVFMVGSFLVSEVLLQSELDRNRDELTAVSKKISIDTDRSPSALAELAVQKEEKRRQLAALQESKTSSEKRLGEVRSDIRAIDRKQGFRRHLPESLGGPPAGARVESLRERREHLDSEIEDIEQQIATTRNELECIDRRMKGESCGSFFERLTGVGKTGIEEINRLADTASNLVVTIAHVLIALFVKNILVPILFLFIALKCGAYIVKRALRLELGLQLEPVEARTEMRRIEPNAGELR